MRTTGTVFGQVVTAGSGNEIPAACDLVSIFDLDQLVVTIDAIHAQYDTATLIATGGGNEVFAVKSNHVTLHR